VAHVTRSSRPPSASAVRTVAAAPALASERRPGGGVSYYLAARCGGAVIHVAAIGGRPMTAMVSGAHVCLLFFFCFDFF